MVGKRHKQDQTIDATKPIEVTFGAFEIGPYRVPYMTAVLRFRQVKEYLSLVTDDPKYSRQNWRLEELYQRDVEQSRVINIADNYLNPTRLDRPPFFNSLTVVLNPKNDVGSFSPPAENPRYKEHADVGPIVVCWDDSVKVGRRKVPKPGTFGTIAWNLSQVYAVAIDGQHRLAALKHLWDRRREVCEGSDIAVIFLVVDEVAGFRVKGRLDPIAVMRSIFIDLNKHAIPVSRARNLLLDDLDPVARFVRVLMGPALKYEKTRKIVNGFPLGEEGEFLTCLPLELVDWHGEQKSKVEKGPYITSVLGLEWLVRKVLKNQYPKQNEIDLRSLSPDDDDYYQKVEKTLKAWEHSWKSGIWTRFEECRERDLPFVLQEDDLELLSQEFRELWASAITRLLTTVTPYKALANLRLMDDSICPEFGQWFQLQAAAEAHSKNSKAVREFYESKLESVEQDLSLAGAPINKYKKLVDRIEKEIKQNSMLFFLVGQRALVLALCELVASRKGDEWAEDAGIDVSKYGSFQEFYSFYLAEAVNAHYRQLRGFRNPFFKDCIVKRIGKKTENLSNAFWAGSLVKRDDPNQVDFSEAAAVRGSKWLVLMAHLYWFDKANPTKDPKELEDLLWNEDALQDKKLGPQILTALGGIVGGPDGKNPRLHPMSFLPGSTDFDWDYEVVKTAARERVRHLVKVLQQR